MGLNPARRLCSTMDTPLRRVARSGGDLTNRVSPSTGNRSLSGLTAGPQMKHITNCYYPDTLVPASTMRYNY